MHRRTVAGKNLLAPKIFDGVAGVGWPRRVEIWFAPVGALAVLALLCSFLAPSCCNLVCPPVARVTHHCESTFEKFVSASGQGDQGWEQLLPPATNVEGLTTKAGRSVLAEAEASAAS